MKRVLNKIFGRTSRYKINLIQCFGEVDGKPFMATREFPAVHLLDGDEFSITWNFKVQKNGGYYDVE